MSRWIIRLLLCLLFVTPSMASRIDEALKNNWSAKKFRAAMRREPNLLHLDADRENVLHRAVRLNRPAQLGLLLENPALVEMVMARNRQGRSAIEVALRLGRLDEFRILLSHLRNPNVRIAGHYQWTLAHLASRRNDAEALRALHEAGANLNLSDSGEEGWTPLDVAVRYNAHEAAAVLRELGGYHNRIQVLVAEPLAAPLMPPQEGQGQVTNPQLLFEDILVQAPITDENDFYAPALPLSDFAMGPAIYRITAAALFLFLANYLFPAAALPFGGSQ